MPLCLNWFPWMETKIWFFIRSWTAWLHDKPLFLLNWWLNCHFLVVKAAMLLSVLSPPDFGWGHFNLLLDRVAVEDIKEASAPCCMSSAVCAAMSPRNKTTVKYIPFVEVKETKITIVAINGLKAIFAKTIKTCCLAYISLKIWVCKIPQNFRLFQLEKFKTT